ncbi:Type II secretion pathway-like protein [Idiomarina sp. HP20-50]|uniref:type IV pilus modification PilV family protein n=1 Tax=Idiomarina sp. HP20-50 TaxID=3070813 RepID=UPI00294B8D8D|nr:Type II secretion pathway-like protein [Idiomarina sp. HP20-50]MDV6316953.1 Type II secretion pathway-like protein [Idiomarina sp. HP20-50]
MNKRKNSGMSFIEVLAGTALVGLWATSSLQLIQNGLSAIDTAYQKARAVEVLMAYSSEVQKGWSLGDQPPAVVESGAFLIESEINEIDSFNATARVTVSWGKQNELTQRFWFTR